MEALDGSNRQSGILSLVNREKVDRINIINPERPRLNMAATAMASPTSSMYSSGPPPPYSSGWSGPAHSMSGLISPPESRRTSDPKHESPAPIQTSQPHRQSLPSIHEALTGNPKSNPYTSPISASLPPTSHQIPYSQPPSAPLPRAYPPADHVPYPPQLAPSQPRQPTPPQSIHPQSSFSRSEPVSASYSETSRHPSIPSIQTAPGPHNPYAPRYEPTRYEPDNRPVERISNGYPPQPPPPPPQQPSYNYGPSAGQGPPPGPHGPMYNQPRYQARDPRDMSDPWKGEKQEPVLFRQGVKRHLDVWDFENNLAEINIASSALREWSAHYNAIAQEQSRPTSSLPERMPSLDSVEDMANHANKLQAALTNMTAIIKEQQETMREQRMREQGMRSGGGPGGDYEEDVGMYGDEMKNHGGGHGGFEGKKRRGRAAPPGRCHSCNRAETPEWRRGPDGARTLCNACGLHYAKLTRKNTMKQSQRSNSGSGNGSGSALRPKSNDDLEGRPPM